MKRIYALLAIAVAANLPGTAFAIYKCEANGAVTYSDAPCPGGKQLDIATAPEADSADAVRRAAREKRVLAQLESERRKQEQKEEKASKKSARIRAALERKCATLDRRRKWAAEDAASAAGKSAEKVKRKAHRAEELFEAECKDIKPA
jgi:hypothetical protein